MVGVGFVSVGVTLVILVLLLVLFSFIVVGEGIDEIVGIVAVGMGVIIGISEAFTFSPYGVAIGMTGTSGSSSLNGGGDGGEVRTTPLTTSPATTTAINTKTLNSIHSSPIEACTLNARFWHTY